MKRMREIKVFKRIIAVSSAIILLFAVGAAALIAFGQPPTHMLTIGYSDVMELMELEPEDFDFTTYQYLEPAPTTVTMEGDTVLSQETGQDAVHTFRLHQDVAEVMDRLDFPLDSATIQLQVLESLEDKVLVKYFPADETGTGCPGCQALVVLDPETHELTALGLNGHGQSHRFQLVFTDEEDIRVLSMDSVSLLQQEAHLEENLTDEELEDLLRQSGMEVELLETKEQYPETDHGQDDEETSRKTEAEESRDPEDEESEPAEDTGADDNNEPDDPTGEETSDTGSGEEGSDETNEPTGDENSAEPAGDESADTGLVDDNSADPGGEEVLVTDIPEPDVPAPDEWDDDSSDQDESSGQEEPDTGEFAVEPMAYHLQAKTQLPAMLRVQTASFSLTENLIPLSLSVDGTERAPSPSAETAPEWEDGVDIPSPPDSGEDETAPPVEPDTADDPHDDRSLPDTEGQDARSDEADDDNPGIGDADAIITHKAIVVQTNEEQTEQSDEIAMDAPGNGLAILRGVMAAEDGSHEYPYVVSTVSELRDHITRASSNDKTVHILLKENIKIITGIKVENRGLVLKSYDGTEKIIETQDSTAIDERSRHFYVSAGNKDRDIFFENVTLKGASQAGGINVSNYGYGGVHISGMRMYGGLIGTGERGHGGAVQFRNNPRNGSINKLVNCNFWGCQAELGGAVYVMAGQLDVIDCQIGQPGEGGGNYAETGGGGIYVNASCTLNIGGQTTIQNNSCGKDGGRYENPQLGGGGIRALPGAVVNFTDNVVVRNNTSINNPGGGMRCAGTVTMKDGSVIFRDNEATYGPNTTKSGLGGGIAFEQTSTLTVPQGGTLQALNNQAHSGGGIAVEEGTLTLDNAVNEAVTIEDNTAKQAGGGIYIGENATLRLPGLGETLVYNNETTAGDGGGVYLDTGAALDVNPSGTPTGNSFAVQENTCSENGGGVYVSDKASAALRYSRIKGNKAKFGGGGFIAWQTSSSYQNRIELLGTELLDNQATSDGGGVYIRLHPTLPLDDDNYGDGNVTNAARYAALYVGSGCSFSGNTAGNGYSQWERSDTTKTPFNQAAATNYNSHIDSNATFSGRGPAHALNNYHCNNRSGTLVDSETTVIKRVVDRGSENEVALPKTTFEVQIVGPLFPGPQTYNGVMEGATSEDGKFLFTNGLPLPDKLPVGTYAITETAHDEYELVSVKVTTVTTDGQATQTVGSDKRFTVPADYKKLEIVVTNQQLFALGDLTIQKLIKHDDNGTPKEDPPSGLVPDGTVFTVKVTNGTDISFTATLTVNAQGGNIFQPEAAAPAYLPNGTYTVTEEPLTDGYNWIGGTVRYNNEGGDGTPYLAADGITFKIADDTTKVDIDVVNEGIPPLVDLRWRKVDARDYTYLNGAEFTLYGCVSTDANHTHSDYAEDSNCWSKVIGTAISGEDGLSDGLLVFEGIPKGVYQLVETKSPEGYALPPGQWRITVDSQPGADGKPVLEIQVESMGGYGWEAPAFINPHDQNFSGTELDNTVTHWIPNREKWVLPATGTGGYITFAMGVMFILLGILLVSRARREEY